MGAARCGSESPTVPSLLLSLPGRPRPRCPPASLLQAPRRPSSPRSHSSRSTGPSWSTCSSGWGCGVWAISPRSLLPTWLPASVQRGWQPGAWRPGSTSDRLPPSHPHPSSPSSAELDPPVETVEPAAFVARGLADELHRRLDARGSACTRVLVGAETEHGERLERVWRHEGALTVAALADRVRWQLDGWLSGSSRDRPTAGLVRLWLAPDEVVPAGGRQMGFWGSDAASGQRAGRAVARVQGLLGPGTVSVPEWQGGRDPAGQVALIGVEAVDLDAERPAARAGWIAEPWPGRLPTPSPATVHDPPLPAEVADESGRTVGVSGRGWCLRHRRGCGSTVVPGWQWSPGLVRGPSRNAGGTPPAVADVPASSSCRPTAALTSPPSSPAAGPSTPRMTSRRRISGGAACGASLGGIAAPQTPCAPLTVEPTLRPLRTTYCFSRALRPPGSHGARRAMLI